MVGEMMEELESEWGGKCGLEGLGRRELRDRGVYGDRTELDERWIMVQRTEAELARGQYPKTR